MTPYTARFVAYFRVSTQKQGRSGLGLQAQRDSVLAYVSNAGGQLCAEYTEVESGKRSDRPELARALAACRVHNATLIVAKLDRLARNVAFVSGLLETGCEFVAVDFPQANRFMLHLLSAVAEYEAQMISTRTKAALQAAKRRGVKLGGNHTFAMSETRKGNRESAAKRSEAAQQRANDLSPIIAEIKAAGAVSLHQIAAGLNQRGIPTARGGRWTATQVSRVQSAPRA